VLLAPKLLEALTAGPSGNKTAAKEMNGTERLRGCLLGLAVGDAVGATLEFRRRGSFEPLKDMVGGGPDADTATMRTPRRQCAASLPARTTVREGFLLAGWNALPCVARSSGFGRNA
jgi:hypothetical protein